MKKSFFAILVFVFIIPILANGSSDMNLHIDPEFRDQIRIISVYEFIKEFGDLIITVDDSDEYPEVVDDHLRPGWPFEEEKDKCDCCCCCPCVKPWWLPTYDLFPGGNKYYGYYVDYQDFFW